MNKECIPIDLPELKCYICNNAKADYLKRITKEDDDFVIQWPVCENCQLQKII